MFSEFHNIGAEIGVQDLGIIFNAVAGGTNDNTQKTSAILDRTTFHNPLSMSLLIAFIATLSANATLSLAWTLQSGEKSDASDATTFASFAKAAVLTDGGSGGTQHGVQKTDIDLAGAGRYLRLLLTTDLSAASTDVSNVAAIPVFGGEDVLPAV